MVICCYNFDYVYPLIEIEESQVWDYPRILRVWNSWCSCFVKFFQPFKRMYGTLCTLLFTSCNFNYFRPVHRKIWNWTGGTMQRENWYRNFLGIELKVRSDDFCSLFVILRFVCIVLSFHWLIGWVNVKIRGYGVSGGWKGWLAFPPHQIDLKSIWSTWNFCQIFEIFLRTKVKFY